MRNWTPASLRFALARESPDDHVHPHESVQVTVCTRAALGVEIGPTAPIRAAS